MCPKQPRVQSDATDRRGDEAGILACCHVAVRTATAGEQELAGPFAGGPQIVIDRLAGGEKLEPPGWTLNQVGFRAKAESRAGLSANAL
jgi:hypothetical protein